LPDAKIPGSTIDKTELKQKLEERDKELKAAHEAALRRINAESAMRQKLQE
jgi:hypothetical protein